MRTIIPMTLMFRITGKIRAFDFVMFVRAPVEG
jgi:hypothetical protein